MNNTLTVYLKLIPFLEELEKIGFRYIPTTGYKRLITNPSQIKTKQTFSYTHQYLEIGIDSFNYCIIRLNEYTQSKAEHTVLLNHKFNLDLPDIAKKVNTRLTSELHSHEKFKHEFRKLKIKKILEII